MEALITIVIFFTFANMATLTIFAMASAALLIDGLKNKSLDIEYMFIPLWLIGSLGIYPIFCLIGLYLVDKKTRNEFLTGK